MENILQEWIEKEEADLEEGGRLLSMVREFGVESFINSHETDENCIVIVDKNGDVIREGN